VAGRQVVDEEVVGRQVVVALGDVEPDLVTGHLPPDTRFVADPDPDDLRAAAGAIVRADALVDVPMLDRMPRLRVLARTGVGVERVDVTEATRRGIAVVVTPGAGTRAVAEGALAMVLHLVKRLRVTTECVAGGRWSERGAITLGDLDGATIGIVGYGRIGRRVGQLADAFGMTVLAHDPYLAPAEHHLDGVELVGLEDLRSRSDVVTLHLPLTPQTHHLVDADFLAGMPVGSVLVNCGRGGLLDLDAAAQALAVGRLAGLGLDVFDPEPPAHHPVFDRTDVVLSPHLMGLSAAATRATFSVAAQGVADVLAGRRPAALANPEWDGADNPARTQEES
jgi:D-3-phosphoglycerate dehydrogenase